LAAFAASIRQWRACSRYSDIFFTSAPSSIYLGNAEGKQSFWSVATEVAYEIKKLRLSLGNGGCRSFFFVSGRKG
jgi:hypothetical protein